MIDAALRLGLSLGVAHASDADHVCTIAGLLRSERGVGDALRTSLVWGLGHSLTFFVVGGLLVAVDVRLPWLAPVAEAAVAGSLVFLGVKQWTHAACPVSEAPARRRSLATFLLGVVHGMAGSAGVGLMALTTMPSRSLAVLFLALYGAGVVAGMAAVTLVLSFPLAAASRSLAARLVVLRGAAAASIAFGTFLAVRLALD